jgi:hypothetical protein
MASLCHLEWEGLLVHISDFRGDGTEEDLVLK